MSVDKDHERVQRMFGQIAQQYDRMNHLLSLNVDRYWRWRTVSLLRPQAGDRILDVCCGTGDLAFAFARRTKGQCAITAVDFCRPMLDIGRQKLARKPQYNHVDFLEADAQNLPFRDNQFDIVSVAFGLRNVADTDRGLSEMTRVCRPGGKVAVLEFSMPQRQPLRALYGFYFRHILPRVGQLLARNDEQAYCYLPQSVSEFPSGELLAQRMLKAGLSTSQYYALTFGIATLYVGGK